MSEQELTEYVIDEIFGAKEKKEANEDLLKLHGLLPFSPCTDRNHSRMVVNKVSKEVRASALRDAFELISDLNTCDVWIHGTPLDETRAAVLAHKAWRSENEGTH